MATTTPDMPVAQRVPSTKWSNKCLYDLQMHALVLLVWYVMAAAYMNLDGIKVLLIGQNVFNCRLYR
jgi:hypothetical protein